MANEPLTEDYLGILTQWVFFFGIIGIWLTPAFLFKDVAKRHNKSVWLFFIIGLAVGFVCFQISVFVMYVTKDLFQGEVDSHGPIANYIYPAMLLIIALLLIWGAVTILRTILERTS